jgi:hypothetical protein
MAKQKHLNDDTEWLGGWDDESEVFIVDDPFEGIDKAGQDLFFQMLDMLPETYREQAMDYFMSRPRKLKLLVKNLKLKKTLIKEGNKEALHQLIGQELTMIEEAAQLDKTADIDNEDDEENDSNSTDYSGFGNEDEDDQKDSTKTGSYRIDPDDEAMY